MCSKYVVSFPHLGNYSKVFTQVMRHMLPDSIVLPAPPMTQRTIELGSRYSPDFVCAPFKLNIGNYIEALEQGANVLFQAGTGCRCGYYGELQEQILRDLGYHFRFVCLSRERAKPQAAYNSMRELGCTLSTRKLIQTLLLAGESIRLMDRYENFMRENVGFEAIHGSLEDVRQELLRKIAEADSMQDLHIANTECKRSVAKIAINKPKDPPRVGIVGDLYTVMEPFSNFYVEKRLAKEGISVSRLMNVSFLLFGQNHRRALKKIGRYLQYDVGANSVDSVLQSERYARRAYDGIIHMKSFGCIPELNAGPALMNLSHDWNIPILNLSFDSHTSETGIATRLEAFSDMINMKKEEKNDSNGQFGRRHRFGVYKRCPSGLQ